MAAPGTAGGAPTVPQANARQDLNYLLDSGPLGRLIAGDRLLQVRVRRYDQLGHILGVPPAVRAEVFAAVWKDRTRKTRLHRVLSGLAGDPETAGDGQRAGELLGRLRASMPVVSIVDALLAAVAERMSAVVLTDDLGDFKRLRDEGGCQAVYVSV